MDIYHYEENGFPRMEIKVDDFKDVWKIFLGWFLKKRVYCPNVKNFINGQEKPVKATFK